MRNLEPHRPPGLQVEDSCEEMGKKIQYIGRYVMDGQTLGKGNFARVELATHGVTKIKVAIKVIDTRKIKEDYVRQNLHREARIMAQLRHPNIIRLYETLKATTLYCLVLEYACGGELLAYIKEQKESRLVESAARPFFRQLLSALQYLHDRGVVHRDLKMENILLDEKKKNIKLVDFGLSNVYSKDQALKTHCGSPEYAAPELFQSGRTYGPEIDVWSLGIITYAMIVGKLPFIMAMTDQYHRQKLLQQIQKGLSTQHDREMQYLTKDCRELIHQLIEPNPELRLSLTEVITKPWVTKNAKLPFTIYQSPPRDKQLRTQVVHELAELMKMERKHVSESVKENRADELSAMFNMLVDQKKRERGFFDLDHTSRRPETRMPVKGRPLGSKGKTDQPGLVKRSIPNKLNVPIERYPASSQGAPHAQENSIQASSVQADSTSELTSVSANKRCAADKAPTRGPTTRIPKRHQTPTHKLNLTLDLSVVNIPAVSGGEARHCTSRQTGSKPPHCRVTSPTKIPQASPNQDSQNTSPDDSSVSSRKKRTCLPLPRPSSHKPARPTSLNFRGGCSAPKGSNPGAKASQQDSRPLVAPKATPEDITFTSSSSDTNLETMQCDMLNASDDEKLEKLERLKHTMLGGCMAKQSDKVCDTDSTAPASQSRAKDIHPSNQLPGIDITEGYVAHRGGTPTQDSLTQKPIAQPSIKGPFSRKDSHVAAECEGATSIPNEIHSGQENNTKSRGHKISFITAKAESNSASDHQYSVKDSGKLIDRVLGAELNSPDHLHIGGSGDRVLASVDDDDDNDDEVCENCEGGAKSPVVSNTPEGMSSKEPSSVHASPELKHCTNCGTQFPSRPKVLFATGAHALDMFVSPEEFSPTTQEWNTQHSCSSRQNPMQAAPLLRGSPSLGSPQLPYMLPPHRMPLVPPVATMHTFNRDAVQHGGSSSKPNGVKVTKNSAERWAGPQNVSNPQTTHTTVQARAATAPSGLRFRFTPANKPHSITENSVYTHVPDKSMRLEPVGAESHSPMGEPFTGNHISTKTSTNNGKIENSKPAEAVTSQQLVRAQSCDKSSPSLSSESQHSTPTNSARWTSRSATPPKSPQKSGTPKWLLMKQYDQQRKQMSWRQGLSHLLRRAKPNGAPSSPSNNVKAKSRSLPANSQLKRREAYYKEMDAKWTAPSSPGPTSNSMQVTSSPVHSSPPTPQHQSFNISHSRTTPPPADKSQEPTASSYGEESRNGPCSSLKYHRRRSNSCKEGVPGETPAEEWQNLDAKVKLEYSIDTAIHKSITVSNAFSSRLPLRHRAKVGQQPTHHNTSKRNT